MKQLLPKTKIVVIGASAGGLDAIKTIVSGLPADFDCAIFIVWHLSAGIKGILPQALNKLQTISAAHAIDKEPIQRGRIYIAPPDHHMMLEKGIVRLTHGPKENYFRPAIDPLFRSAAYLYGSRVIGIVLSGGLDDGTAGLWTIKRRGGMAIVQQPSDAEVASMPANAIEAVDIDFIVPVKDMATLLIKLVGKPLAASAQVVPAFSQKEEKNLKTEINIAFDEYTQSQHTFELGEISKYACPDCYGVLTAINEGGRIRYRCHTGHAFSLNNLVFKLAGKIESDLRIAGRGLEELRLLLNQIGDAYASENKPREAAFYFTSAQDTTARSTAMRQFIDSYRQFGAYGNAHKKPAHGTVNDMATT